MQHKGAPPLHASLYGAADHQKLPSAHLLHAQKQPTLNAFPGQTAHQSLAHPNPASAHKSLPHGYLQYQLQSLKDLSSFMDIDQKDAGPHRPPDAFAPKGSQPD